MKLYIASRQAAARTIALALSSKQESFARDPGYFQTVQGDCVTWTGGHLLELADPETYHPEYHRWHLEDLPIIPDYWKLLESHADDRGTARRARTEQLNIIRRFLGEADEVIHAGDPDREGQWMIDEVLQYLENTQSVKRLLIDDLNIPAVRSALTALQDNQKFIHLSESAKARSRIDWLYGINMTRALTLLGRHSGYEGVLSVGRVQTPVLAMVVKRDEAIEGFKPKHYFEVNAKIVSKEAKQFCYAKWKNNLPDKNPDELLQDRSVCELLEKKVQGKEGVVVSYQDRVISEAPSLPFDLSSLQMECENLWGYSAREVMDISWQLYEKHHLISYPRSDCRYLPESFFDKSVEVLEAISSNVNKDPGLQEKIHQSDCWIKQRCWNDARVSSHHGIIPVSKHIDTSTLSDEEKKIYTLIAARYVEQFYPDRTNTQSEIVFNVEGELFLIQEEKTLQANWSVGQVIICDDIDIKERLSRPPQRFTSASLIEAMDGLGTQASRALILEGLLQRGYLIKGNKSIFSTPIGRDLIRALPALGNNRDAVMLLEAWEKKLAAIETGTLSYEIFMQEFQKQLTELIDNIRHKKTIQVTSADKILGLATEEKFYCPKCQAILVMRHGKHGVFWGCSRYPECKNTLPDRVDKNGIHHPLFKH